MKGYLCFKSRMEEETFLNCTEGLHRRQISLNQGLGGGFGSGMTLTPYFCACYYNCKLFIYHFEVSTPCDTEVM